MKSKFLTVFVAGAFWLNFLLSLYLFVATAIGVVAIPVGVGAGLAFITFAGLRARYRAFRVPSMLAVAGFLLFVALVLATSNGRVGYGGQATGLLLIAPVLLALAACILDGVLCFRALVRRE